MARRPWWTPSAQGRSWPQGRAAKALRAAQGGQIVGAGRLVGDAALKVHERAGIIRHGMELRDVARFLSQSCPNPCVIKTLCPRTLGDKPFPRHPSARDLHFRSPPCAKIGVRMTVRTGTTGERISEFLEAVDIPRQKINLIDRRASGPVGGDVEIAGEVLRGNCHHMVFFVFTVLTFLLTASTSIGVISIESEKIELPKAGEQFTIDLTLTKAVANVGYQFTLAFDPTVLSFLKSENGNRTPSIQKRGYRINSARRQR